MLVMQSHGAGSLTGIVAKGSWYACACKSIQRLPISMPATPPKRQGMFAETLTLK